VIIFSPIYIRLSTALRQTAVIMSRHIPSTNMCVCRPVCKRLPGVVQLGRMFENRLHVHDAFNLEMSADKCGEQREPARGKCGDLSRVAREITSNGFETT